MSLEYSAEILEEFYKILYTDRVLPQLEQHATQPVPQDAITAILDWRRQLNLSLPHAVALGINHEAEFFNRTYEEDCRALEIPMPPLIIKPSTLYIYASSCLVMAEEHLRSDDMVEQALQESVEYYGEEAVLAGDIPDTKIAEGHILMNSWVQRLREDPTGFIFIDAIVSGELPSQLAPTIIQSREMPYMRVIELGAQRYKSLYQATTQ